MPKSIMRELEIWFLQAKVTQKLIYLNKTKTCKSLMMVETEYSSKAYPNTSVKMKMKPFTVYSKES